MPLQSNAPSQTMEAEVPRKTDRSAAELKMVVITADHVYLPLDDEGNGRAEWRDVEETTKVEKRARLQVPADLAAVLSERDQAEIL